MSDLSHATQSGKAQLPVKYEAAKFALAEAEAIDECKDWGDKAAALASYAKQSKDKELECLAMRIRLRANQRMGQLLKEIERGSGKNHGEKGEAPPLSKTRKSAAEDAGLSPDQAKTAIRIANVPDEDFEEMVESKTPPTVTKMADMGKTPTQVFRDSGKTKKEFTAAIYLLGSMRDYLSELNEHFESAVDALTDEERKEAAQIIKEITKWHQQL